MTESKYINYVNTLNKIGIALSSEKDKNRLLEIILSSAMELTNADGGTLYLLTKDNCLAFEILANNTLKMLKKRIDSDNVIPNIPLIDKTGAPNLKNIASYCILTNQTQNITDAYAMDNFDFSGMKKMDLKLGYHSQSFLTIPLRNHEKKSIGVLQLINAMDEERKNIIPFSDEKVQLAESLASQAAITLTQQELIQAQKDLFDALIKLIAQAIDEKSKYTSNHCSRVPIIAMMIAEAANHIKEGPLKDFSLTKDELEELRVSAWLHDCGKISVPEHVVDKATKLEMIFDRMELLTLRFEILKRDMKIALLEKTVADDVLNEIKQHYQAISENTNQEIEWLKKINAGGEFLSDADKEKIQNLTKKTYELGNQIVPLLTDNEVMNLSISRGTLNAEDREIIKNHVKVSQKILSSLPYPDYLKNVPEIAGNHHEMINGKGYPIGIKGDAISIQARIVAIADIFEALTAADRPYKPAKTLTETLQIMTNMKNEGHIDANLFDLFLKEKLYLKYANEYLLPEQIDTN